MRRRMGGMGRIGEVSGGFVALVEDSDLPAAAPRRARLLPAARRKAAKRSSGRKPAGRSASGGRRTTMAKAGKLATRSNARAGKRKPAAAKGAAKGGARGTAAAQPIRGRKIAAKASATTTGVT